jgi:hypothetical protein
MHRAARIFGLLWIAAIAVAGTILWAHNASLLARGLYGAYGLLVILFASALPGVLLVRWGRGPYVRPPTVRDMLRPKAPYDRATEAGHTMTVEPDSD